MRSPRFELVEELLKESPESQFWNEPAVLGRQGGEPTSAIGLVAYQQATFDLADRPDLKLTVLVEGHRDVRRPSHGGAMA